MIKNQELIVKYVSDTVLMLKQQSKLVQDATKFAHIDPVFHSCIKQMEGLLNAEQNYLNKLVREQKSVV
jgi:hypothetical protein